jgi:hypothetical protein
MNKVIAWIRNHLPWECAPSYDEIISLNSKPVEYPYFTPAAYDGPDWEMKYGILRYATVDGDGDGDVVGIFGGPIDITWTLHSDLFIPADGTFKRLNMTDITKEEYGTHVAFETFPVLEIVKETGNGILLKLPDE